MMFAEFTIRTGVCEIAKLRCGGEKIKARSESGKTPGVPCGPEAGDCRAEGGAEGHQGGQTSADNIVEPPPTTRLIYMHSCFFQTVILFSDHNGKLVENRMEKN